LEKSAIAARFSVAGLTRERDARPDGPVGDFSSVDGQLVDISHQAA
jgi:hypothetical protein